MTITVTRSVSTPTALGNPGDEVQITEECSGKTIRASLDELGAIPRNIDLASNERWNVSVQGMQVATLAPPRRMLSNPKAGRAS